MHPPDLTLDGLQIEVRHQHIPRTSGSSQTCDWYFVAGDLRPGSGVESIDT